MYIFVIMCTEVLEITDLLQKLTHTGETKLDSIKLARFKELCLCSNAYIDHAYILLMGHLSKKHAEVRYSALLVCDILFKKSSYFRSKMVADLHDLMQYTVGIRKEFPLPPPKPAAKALRQRALTAIFDWYQQFKIWHVELESAFEFLRDCHKVDFKSIEKQLNLELKKKEEEEKQKQLKIKGKEILDKTLRDMNENFDDASSCVTTLETCIALLLPPPEEFFVPEIADIDSRQSHLKTSDEEPVELREYGVIDSKQTITVEVPKAQLKLKVDKDNYDTVTAARDVFKEIKIKCYISKIKSWAKVLDKDSGVDSRYQAAESLLKKMERVIDQYYSLGIQEVSYNIDESEDSDMEEVCTKEGYEAEVKDAMLEEMLRENAEKRELERKCVAQQNLHSVSPQPGPSKTEMQPAPILPTNIEEWEHKDIPKPHVVVGMKLDNHQVWLSASSQETEEVVAPTLSSCPIEFTSRFEPVKWACRARLPSGKLCPRKDRVKCPLHGLIVPRNNEGKCSRPEDAKAESEREEQHRIQNPDWQDPKWLEEIKKNTGIDLKMPEKGKRKRKPPEFPGLTDIRKKKDTPHTRLAKKIFKRSDMKALLKPQLDTTGAAGKNK